MPAQKQAVVPARLAPTIAFDDVHFSYPGGRGAACPGHIDRGALLVWVLLGYLVAQAFDGVIPALNAGKFDAIMAGMNITDKRKEAIAFTQPYGRTPSTFAGRSFCSFASSILPVPWVST